MFRHRALQALHSLGLEFWLPLPILGLFFWVGGGLMTDYLLSRSYYAKAQFRANTQLQGQPAKIVQSIKVQIKSSKGFSKVKVKTANSALKELEFEFPLTESRQIEAAIATELGLSDDDVRRLVRYQTD